MGALRDSKNNSITTPAITTFASSSPAVKIEIDGTAKIYQNTPSNRLTSLLSPKMMWRINDERLRTTYQRDFGNSNRNTTIYYDKLATTGSRKKLQEIECRNPPKLPFLHGHEVPGRVRPKSLLNDTNKKHGRCNLKSKKIMRHERSVSYNEYDREKFEKQLLGGRSNAFSERRNGLDNGGGKFKMVKIPRYVTPIINEKTGSIVKELTPSAWVSEYQDTIGYTADGILENKLHSRKRASCMNKRNKSSI